MSKLEQIERTVEELEPKEFEAFSNWFEALQARRWDSQIEADAKDGKLDSLAANAVTAFRAGKTEAAVKHVATADFWQAYKALPARVQNLADQNFKILTKNPMHPSLHFKRVGNFWSARVGSSWRALAAQDGETIIWFWIGSHADYDKLVR